MPKSLRSPRVSHSPFVVGTAALTAPPLVGAEPEESSSPILSNSQETMLPTIGEERELNGFVVEEGVNPYASPTPTQTNVLASLLDAAKKRKEMIDEGTWVPLVA